MIVLRQFSDFQLYKGSSHFDKMILDHILFQYKASIDVFNNSPQALNTGSSLW
jgi:hypothetical protein